MHACVCVGERERRRWIESLSVRKGLCVSEGHKTKRSGPLGPVPRNCAGGILAILAARGSIFPQVTDSDIIKPLLTRQTISTPSRPGIDNRPYQTHTELAKICPQSKPFTLWPTTHYHIPTDSKKKQMVSSVKRKRESKKQEEQRNGDVRGRKRTSPSEDFR